MQMPNIIWPITQLGTDDLNGAACTVFALAHWRSVVAGTAVDSDQVQAIYQKQREFRGRSTGLTVAEAFFGVHQAGMLPAGTTIRRVHDLSRLVYGPLIASYVMRADSRTTDDGVIPNTGNDIGTHTMLIVGWDGEHLHLANSWGPYWGNRGVGLMSLSTHEDALIGMYQVVVPGQPSTPKEAAEAAAEAIPRTLADQVAAVHRNLLFLGYTGLPTTATIIMPDIIRRSMAGALTQEQERAKSNLAHVYTMLLLQGVPDAQINAVHAATNRR